MDSSLTVHWPYLALGLAMLWLPRQWMRLGRIFRRRRQQRELFEKFAQQGGRDPDDKSVRLGKELGKKRNYLDLFRGLVGGYALWHFSFEAATKDADVLVVLVAGAISLIGLLVQSVRREEGRANFFAPLFFCAGLSLAMDVPYAGGFAFLLTCAINPMLPNPRMFLTCYGLLVLAFGVFFGESLIVVLANAVLLFALPLITVLAGRSLVIYSKRGE